MDIDFGSEIRKLLADIAPERANDLESLVSGVTFQENVYTELIDFQASGNWKVVIVPMRCQMRLWAHCYANYCAVSAFGARWDPRLGLADVPPGDLELADQMLEWAVTSDVVARSFKYSGLNSTAPLPAGAPLPFDDTEPNHICAVSQQMFLCGLAFIIHHELAHVKHGHQGGEGSLSIEQEETADREAAQWLLGSKFDEPEYYIRHIGVATALLWFVSIFMREKHYDRTHPPAWERLVSVLSPSVQNETDAIWGFVAIVLSIHCHRHGVSLNGLSEYAPTKETVLEMIGLVAKHNQGLSQ